MAAAARDDGTVLAVGSINADFEMRVPQPPRPGRTHLGTDLLRTSGGKAANVAVLAARLGVHARLFGCVGDDDLAGQALAGPRAASVDVTGVQVAAGPTALSTIVVPPDGDKIIVLVPGANDAPAEPGAARLVAAVRETGAPRVLVADLEVAAGWIRPALAAARQAGVPTVLDPSPADRLTDDLLPLVDHVTPNADEAGQLTGVAVRSADDAAVAAARLRERGVGAAYVRMSHGGCVVADATGTRVVTAPDDIPVVDATGAGDAFTGALGVAVLHGLPPPAAAMIAVAASSCAVGGYGSQESYPTRAALAAMARRVRRASAREREPVTREHRPSI
ncbi:ribokinase [Planosporangium thailandense]|uniref:Ribokinase n=1 Tax=Planosporangium thailandense TaxID=765197 RepID=A0ABX0XYR8_9ACTN|nr:PfkB family carbohydrate kinase [Planosporangium thailandense]NJC71206.1 ribokinase [Planosporangium thailandense]